jgi:hypothetical protein
MDLDELGRKINGLPLDVRMDFLTSALASTRAEIYGLHKQRWEDSIKAASATELKKRLATLDLPCWSTEDVEVPPAVVKTDLVWEGVFIKVLLNEDRCMAIPFEGYEFAVCETHDEILHDKDARAHLDCFIMKACSDMYGRTTKADDAKEEDCDFSSYASTTCLCDNVEDLEESCSQLGVLSWASDELRVTYLRGDLRLTKYDRAADAQQLPTPA